MGPTGFDFAESVFVEIESENKLREFDNRKSDRIDLNCPNASDENPQKIAIMKTLVCRFINHHSTFEFRFRFLFVNCEICATEIPLSFMENTAISRQNRRMSSNMTN